MKKIKEEWKRRNHKDYSKKKNMMKIEKKSKRDKKIEKKSKRDKKKKITVVDRWIKNVKIGWRRKKTKKIKRGRRI